MECFTRKLCSILALTAVLGPIFAFTSDAIIIPSVSQTEGRTFGNRDGYTTLELFALPEPYTDEIVPFIDLRGHHFDNGRWAANVGVGGRYYVCDWQMALGANVYYDYREFRHSQFQNIGVGLELLTDRLNFRVNGYIPVGNQVGSNQLTVFDNFIGPYVINQNKRHVTMGGVDGEVEALVYQSGCFQLWAAAGAYYFTDTRRVFNSSRDDIVGGEFRLEADVNQYLALEGILTTDRIFHTRVQGKITLSLPLDFFGYDVCSSGWCEGCCWLEQMYMRTPRRYEIIPMDPQCCYTTNY